MKTETVKHTPTPWSTRKMSMHTAIESAHRRITEIGYVKGPGVDSEVDAAFIVRACNAHEELLAALKEAREFVTFAATKLQYQSAGKEFEPNRESAEGTLARMEQAIARAGEYKRKEASHDAD